LALFGWDGASRRSAPVRARTCSVNQQSVTSSDAASCSTARSGCRAVTVTVRSRSDRRASKYHSSRSIPNETGASTSIGVSGRSHRVTLTRCMSTLQMLDQSRRTAGPSRRVIARDGRQFCQREVNNPGSQPTCSHRLDDGASVRRHGRGCGPAAANGTSRPSRLAGTGRRERTPHPRRRPPPDKLTKMLVG
jgi:hypothetical protein